MHSPSGSDNIKYYIDYEKFARDCQLGGNMCEFKYAGKTYTYNKYERFITTEWAHA